VRKAAVLAIFEYPESVSKDVSGGDWRRFKECPASRSDLERRPLYATNHL
jgi:hypothetical protein